MDKDVHRYTATFYLDAAESGMHVTDSYCLKKDCRAAHRMSARIPNRDDRAVAEYKKAEQIGVGSPSAPP